MLTIIAIATVALVALDRLCGDSGRMGQDIVVRLVTLPVQPVLVCWDAWKDGRQRRNCGM